MTDEERAPVTVTEAEVRALFVDFSTPEWVEVPGQPESRVAFQPMSPHRRRQYLSEGQSIRISGGRAEAVGDVRMDVATQDLTLLMACVVDWRLKLRKPVKGDPTEFVDEISPAPARDEARRNTLKEWFSTTMSEDFAAWLVDQCKRVNRLREADLGN